MGFTEAEVSDIKEALSTFEERTKDITSSLDSIEKILMSFGNLTKAKQYLEDAKKVLNEDENSPREISYVAVKKDINASENEIFIEVKKIPNLIDNGIKSIKNRIKELKDFTYDRDKILKGIDAIDGGIMAIEGALLIIKSAINEYMLLENQLKGGTKIVEGACKIIKDGLEKLKFCISSFIPDGSRNCPPHLLHFTIEEGKKLNKANVKWTSNSHEEDNVSTYLQKEKDFVFYRHGQFSGSTEDPKEAIDIACREIFWDHYLLVVGDDIGLEEELQTDIKIVAALADVEDDDLQYLLESIHNGFNRIYGKNGVFTLLVNPSNSVLKERLKEFIKKCPNLSLTIIFSGHGEQEFGWVLAGDDRFSGSDLKQVLSDVEPQHYPEITILLNFCYGLSFAEKVINMESFFAFLKVQLKLSSDVEEYLKNASVLPDDSSNWDGWFIKNEHITKSICEIVKKCSSKFVRIDNLPFAVSVVPFAIGPLSADGILLQEKVGNKYEKMDWSKVRAPPKPLPSCTSPPLQILQDTNTDPLLIVFGAGNGDSTFFHWFDFNMLVDGGIYQYPPCCWNTVCRLPLHQKLDVVVVTHYDDDHICGILKLFKELKFSKVDNVPFKISKLYTTEPPETPEQPETQGTRSPIKGKELWKLASKHCITNNLVCNPTMPMLDEPLSSQCRLRVFMLTPTREKLKKATELMKKSRRLTIPNQASASLLIECTIKEQYKYALLTGDAPSEDIIGGLDQLKENDSQVRDHCYQDGRYSFDYIDMPHHGSVQNNPEYFLSKIKSKVCVVSTNSRGKHNHPDVETLHQLDTAMKEGNIEEDLLFTYCNERPLKSRTISDAFTNENKRKLFFADNNPANQDCKQCLLVRLATPTIAWQKRDIEQL